MGKEREDPYLVCVGMGGPDVTAGWREYGGGGRGSAHKSAIECPALLGWPQGRGRRHSDMVGGGDMCVHVCDRETHSERKRKTEGPYTRVGGAMGKCSRGDTIDLASPKRLPWTLPSPFHILGLQKPHPYPHPPPQCPVKH